MTVVALWYGGDTKSLNCAADTRITRGRENPTITTDSGPKIFNVSVICRVQRDEPVSWPVTHSHSFGFAYSGNVVAALSTFALATACTQNLTCGPGKCGPVSIESVAKLFQDVAQHCLVDMSVRLGKCDNIETYFFTCLVFGFCPVSLEYTAYKIEPTWDESRISMQLTHLPIGPESLYAIGSGTKEFLADSEKRRLKSGAYDPIETLKLMLDEETREDVGGYIQFGMSGKGDFRILPVLDTSGDDPAKWPVSFLGWDVAGAGDVSGYSIGYNAVDF